MRLLLLAAAIGSIAALAGCATSRGLQPNGTPIEPTSLKAERSFANMHVSAAAWPRVDWWTGLNDPQLNALIVEALRDSPSLSAAEARARQAQAQAGIADAARRPTLNVGAAVDGTRFPTTALPSSFGAGHYEPAEYTYASFKWDLDLWGGKRAAWEAALGQARAADIDVQATRIELSGNVARAYVQLGYAYAQQDVAKAEMSRAAEAHSLTIQRVAAGIDNQLQLKQTDSEVASAQGQQAMVDRAVDAARSALSVLLGKGPDRGLDIARPVPMSPSLLAVPANLPVELIGHRADLVAARWRVEATSKDIKAAKTEFLPNVSLSALTGFVAVGQGTNPLQLPARFYTAGPSISLPIFDGGRLRANLDSTDAQYDFAIAQYNLTLVRALNEVADDCDAIHSIQQQIDAEQRALDAANGAWTLAEQRYKAGVGSYLEALSTRQQLLIAEQGMASLHAQQTDLSVQLIQALGGGYRPQAEGAAPTFTSSNRS
jgi:NodT family efflux transporter outer membrane factor (OMF) lipoprotein